MIQGMASDLPPPSGVVFDLDGTLVDTVEARIGGWLEALAGAGYPTTRDVVAPMIGMDGRRLARLVAHHMGPALRASSSSHQSA